MRLSRPSPWPRAWRTQKMRVIVIAIVVDAIVGLILYRNLEE